MFLTILFCVVASLIGADVYSALRARLYSYQNTSDIPNCEFGLILGTAKYLGTGNSINRYYQYRINAALELWHAGKVNAFIVSGSGVNNRPSETACMQADLVAAGVPSTAIWQDAAGLRTLDSIVRYQQKFGSRSVCIISQPFHNQRALVQARHYQLNAYAYNAKIVGVKAGWKIHARERFARIKLWYDLLARTQPLYPLAQIDIIQLPTQPDI